MSQLKPKRVSSSAKLVGQRNETNSKTISNNLLSKRQDSNHPPSSCSSSGGGGSNGGSCSQTRAGSFKNNFAYVCSGCSKPIRRDKFLLKACDKYWHEDCLKCDRCHSRLGELGSTLYCKSNMNLCRQDYLEMFGKTGVCSVCEKLICASEMVMRAKQNVYHLECFACQLCSQRFCVGDRFYLCENKVVCQYDYEEHILPIQQSMIAEQTADSIYTTAITHQDPINTIEFSAEQNNDSMIEQNPEEPRRCVEPEGELLNGRQLSDSTNTITSITTEEKGETSGEKMKASGSGDPGKTDGSKDMDEFEAPNEECRA